QQLKERYQQELANLERKHQEEKQRLIGRYAAAGFSEPGILEGPMAGVPGIVTKALQELGEQQARERTQLQQAAAGDITAIQMAQAEAERKAQQQAYEQWAREQQRKLENILKQAGLLETIYSYVAPQRMTVGGRILEYDPLSGSYKDVTPTAVTEALRKEEIEKAWSSPDVDDEGNVWRVNKITGEMQIIGKIAKKPTITDATRVQTIGIFLESRKGKDGFVSAEDYLKARQQWIAMGGTLSDFNAAFPYYVWMGPWEYEKIPEFSSKTGTTSEEEAIKRILGIP
ncbi:MAG: hypothetical protein QXS37_06050, partial [Candidatus Aenigmatarchaeota archaeon]